MVDLTIGMAVYNDFDGVYFTVQALRLYHDLDDVELLVVDNYGCEHTKNFVEGWAKGRYILATEATGTAAPRDLVFREAKGEAVLCCDSHVLFAPGVIARLKAYYRDHPQTRDLLQGPIVYDNLQSISTHFDPVWRAQMWGTWGTDPRGLDPEGEPFDIPMQGLGVFSCRKDAWLGFNPAFRGFGGEEGYIHEKFRQAGARTLCLPWFRWGHRFSRPGRVTYRLTVEDKLRNYIIGHTELGLDLAPVLEHFAEYLPAETLAAVTDEVLRDQATMTLKEETQGKKKKEKKGKKNKKNGGGQNGKQADLEFTPANEVSEDISLAHLTEAHGGALPLVSCICPTYARPPERQYLIEEAVESFLRQTYPNKELIVLNDCPEQELVCDAPGVRVVNAHQRFPSLGDKRNVGVLLSAGELIAPWDDDDISLPWRLSYSVERLRNGDYYNPFKWWHMQGGTLHVGGGVGHNMSLFRRSAWETVGGYPSITNGEDQAIQHRLRETVRFVSEDPVEEWPESDWYYIYRWGVSPKHVSSRYDDSMYPEIGTLPVESGRFVLRPHWTTDYVNETRLFLEEHAANRTT